MSDLTRDMRACVKPWEGTGHIAEKLMLRGASRIEELEAALKIIASGFLGDKVLAEWELSNIAEKALQA